MSRTSIPPQTQARVLTESRRRCALCVFLRNDSSERVGQIAHLNQNASDNRFENLVWLCFEHHDKYDSKTSQSKNYTEIEVAGYRDRLYAQNNAAFYPAEEIQKLRQFLNELNGSLSYIFNEREQLAQAILGEQMTLIELATSSWESNQLRSFSNDIRSAQDRIMAGFRSILSIYDLSSYDGIGRWIKFNNHRWPRELLKHKEREVVQYVDNMLADHEWLRAVASE